MSTSTPGFSPLADFEHPPLVEVALAIQFDSIERLRGVHMGLLWQRWRETFPLVEEHPSLPSVVERFDGSERPRQVKLELLDEPPGTRCWFLTREQDQLLQVQRDRVIFNWRRREGASDYPRYPAVRECLAKHLSDFRKFVEDDERLGELRPNQCEVTYVNVVEPSARWRGHWDLATAVTVFTGQTSDDFLPEVERAQMSLSYLIQEADEHGPLGRLHVEVQPGVRTTDNCQVLRIKLTARGSPRGSGLDGALAFLDLGREWVVRGFASLTTAEMHEQWGRRDAP